MQLIVKLLSAVVCFLTKYLIFQLFPQLSVLLDNSIEFSTPVSSFKTLQEGWYLIDHGLPLYYKRNGGIINQSPLLIYLLKPVSQYINVVYCAIDAVSLLIFIELVSRVYAKGGKTEAQRGDQEKSSSSSSNLGLKMALLYILNPLIFLNCISKSTTVFNHFFILLSLLTANDGSFVLSAAFIAISGYLNFHSLYLIIPLTLFARREENFTLHRMVQLVGSFIASILVLLYTSYIICDKQWWFLYNVYYVNLTFDKIFPNIGLWWYFFIEMFQFFRPFFICVFNLFTFSFVVPFTIRFRSFPMNCFIITMGWIILTKSYPTFGETGFFLQFLIFFDKFQKFFRYKIISTLIFLHSIILAPIFYYLWISLGSGNSNFFYAISLVHGVAMASVVFDMVWSTLRMECNDDSTIELVQI